MKTIKLIIFIPWMFSCNQTHTDENLHNNNPFHYMLDLKKWQNEILDIDSVRIGQNIFAITNSVMLEKEFGRPDSILKSDGRFSFFPYIFEKDSLSQAYFLFYDGVVFEKMNEVAVISTIDFRVTNIKLIHPKIVLYQGMNVRELTKIYPESCKLVSVNGNAWSGQVELKTSAFGLDPRRWFLIFQGEELIKVLLISFSRK